ncbi:UNVERIFIED_CONTAM: hypothetical protein HDU68_005642, partial [Siphonaria sp. JEL0065]
FDPSINHNRALRWACRNGHFETVQLLLGVVVINPGWSEMCISLAAEFGHCEIVRLLLKDSRFDPQERDSAALRLASQNGHDEAVRLLLDDMRSDPTIENNSPVRIASFRGHLKAVQALLGDSRVDPSSLDNFAIRAASQNGHLEVVTLLLANPRVDPGIQANSSQPIRAACQNGHIQIAKLLLSDARVNPMAEGGDCLHVALQHKQVEVIQALLHNERVLFHPWEGLELLDFACDTEDILTLVKSIIEHSSFTRGSATDYIPLIYSAARRSKIKLVEVLLTSSHVSEVVDPVYVASFKGDLPL